MDDTSDRTPPAQYWEQHYVRAERIWSGRVNTTLAEIASGLTPGRALDLGCGEGADAIWLGQNGWRVLGIDISRSAIDRARDAARDAGLAEDQVGFLAADLAELPDEEPQDLVTASFLHSPVELRRSEILRRASDRVAPGGHLLITSHAALPHGAHVPDGPMPLFLTPDEEVAELALDTREWTVLVAELRPRTRTGPDGSEFPLEDSVVLLQRRLAV